MIALLAAIDPIFYRTVSKGIGIIDTILIVETHVGSKKKLLVKYDELKVTGNFVGNSFPSKGDRVYVECQKSILLQRKHYIFTEYNQ